MYFCHLLLATLLWLCQFLFIILLISHLLLFIFYWFYLLISLYFVSLFKESASPVIYFSVVTVFLSLIAVLSLLLSWVHSSSAFLESTAGPFSYFCHLTHQSSLFSVVKNFPDKASLLLYRRSFFLKIQFPVLYSKSLLLICLSYFLINLLVTPWGI